MILLFFQDHVETARRAQKKALLPTSINVLSIFSMLCSQQPSVSTTGAQRSSGVLELLFLLTLAAFEPGKF